MEDLQLGCIGCGFIADIHLRNALRMAGVRIRAVADIREDAARGFHQRFQSDYWTTDPQKLLADASLDGVLICTYHNSHAPLAIAAARAGKHVFLEKPMAGSAAECLEIIRACEENRVKLALDLKFRFTAAVHAVRHAIRRPVLVVAQTSMDPLPEADGSRRGFDAGIIQDLGAHSLDLACFLAGSEPVRIFAVGTRLPDRRTSMLDAVAGTVELESGCMASFVISDCGEWPRPSKWYFEVADGKRNAVVHNHCRTADLGGDVNESIDQSDIPAHEIGSYESLADFVDAVRHKRLPKVSGTDGLRFALLNESLLESIRLGRPVEVKGPEGAEPWYRSEYAAGVR